MTGSTLYYNALEVNKLLCEMTHGEQDAVNALVLSAKLLAPLYPTILQSLHKVLCNELQIG